MTAQTRIGSSAILYDMPLFIDWELPAKDDAKTWSVVSNICANLKALNRAAYHIRLLGAAAGRSAAIIYDVFNGRCDSVERVDVSGRMGDGATGNGGSGLDNMHFVCGATNLFIDVGGNAWGNGKSKMANLSTEKVFPEKWLPFICGANQLTPYETSGKILPGFYFEKEAQAWLDGFKARQKDRVAEWLDIDPSDFPLGFLAWMSPQFADAVRKLLTRRQDLEEMLDGQDGEPRFLLWLWQHGLQEEESIRENREELEQRLRELASEPFWEDALPGYTRLLHTIWQAREDLRRIDTSTVDGQAEVLKWFYKYGATEHELTRFLKKERQNTIRFIDVTPLKQELDPFRYQMMSLHDHAFIKWLLDIYKPRKIVEVGIAAGGTTAFLLKQTGHGQRVYGVDNCKNFYLDPEKLTGYIVEENNSPSEKERCVILRGKDVIERLEEIGAGIDFLILDTAHRMPGEVMSFLACYPYLKKGACVVVHDLSLNYRNSSQAPDKTDAYCTRVLWSAIGSGKKYLPNNEHHSIGAIEIDDWTERSIESVFMALGISWNYYPEAMLPLYADFFKEHYSRLCQSLFSQYSTYMQAVVSHRKGA